MSTMIPQARGRLTERHLQCLRLAAKGMRNAQIGRELYLTEDTVKTHLRRAYALLGVHSRAAAVFVAMERGLLTEPEKYGGPERRRGPGGRRRGDARNSRPSPSRP